jgi:hypothetical protein
MSDYSRATPLAVNGDPEEDDKEKDTEQDES